MKKGKATNSTIESLPREIMADILSRVTTPSLFIIKFVCQSWRNLAQDPLLVDLHFSHKIENNPCLILHSDHPTKNQLYALCLYPHNTSQDGMVMKIPVPVKLEFDVVGSCKGWLCLYDSLHKNTFYMYNPFTNSCMELPISNFPSDVWTVLGFGFDPFRKKYKVLKVSYIRRTNNTAGERYGLSLRSEVQILTVGSPSWRSLGETPYYPIHSPSQVYVNGRLHWVNWPVRYRPGRKLISFDLEDEKFREVPLPGSDGIKWGDYMLVVIRDCLSAAVYRNYGSFEVWVMKDYGLKESWIKEFSIGVYLPKGLEQKIDPSFRVSKFYRRAFTRILCVLKNGEILLEYGRRALVSYEARFGTFKDITVPGMPNWFEAFAHLGNLDI
ncbi:F-box protein At3g07870-like [Ricinus communis]|uniref:F-box protein At3g07870-like n=1 Tax=Ricinus communis TaxID=3988 RepID=UPI00201AE472|nr:F-box protein At3g07870-like [Ricinus communis]